MAEHSHSHSHGEHISPHSHSHGYAEANKGHYDEEEAKKYDERPSAIELARRLGEAMVKAYPFDESRTTVMDFACGTGMISRELAAYTSKIVGIDISEAMVKIYNQRVENQGIPSDEMQAVCMELKGTDDELDSAKFDVVVCASAYHHFESIESITKTLAFFLKPGGTLMVADILKITDNKTTIGPADGPDIVAHKTGFEPADIQEAFDTAGLRDMDLKTVCRAKKHGHDVEMFLAKAIKPS